MLVKGPLLHYCRLCDRLSADRVDHFIGNSATVARRIAKHYRREATIIYPPVDVDQFLHYEPEFDDFYLFVSRLVPYKRADLAVAAARRTGRPLKVVGDGPELRRLMKMARGANVTFLGAVSQNDLVDLYRRCKAVIFPGFEDFGIVPVEAMAAGKPVIAYGRGGASETVIDGETGLLFEEQTVESLADGLLEFEYRSWNPSVCRRRSESFARARFLNEIKAFVDRALAHFV
jgi:glycosyltransferase involved in cell wall biosynthesis